MHIENIKKVLTGEKTLSSQTLIIAATLFIIIFDNHAFWSPLFSVIDMTDPSMYLFLFACFSVIFSIIYTFIAIFGTGKLLKPVIALLIFISSMTAYYMDSYGTVFDDVMVLNILETNAQESMDLIEASILLHIFIFAVIPILILYRVKITHTVLAQEIRTRFINICLFLLIASSTVYITYKDFTFIFRENREISFFINPIYPLRSVYRYSAQRIKQHNDTGFKHIFADAHPVKKHPRKNILVLVVGETARAQEFHLDGYYRDTTPNLEKNNVINFTDVHSCGTATAISLPCMFSDLTHENFDHDASKKMDNLLDALKTAGVDVMWQENNPDCKGVCNRIETHDYSDIHQDKYCHNDLCFDEALFNGLNKYIDNMKHDAVIVLHTQGSHGPAYYKRYPEHFKTFQPECHSSDVQRCTDIEVRNAYDNTILYTDYFLAKLIDYLKKLPNDYNPAMIYVSDHGESLGEKGIYLHGLPYFMAPEFQTKVPMIFWLPEKFTLSESIDTDCLRNKENMPLSHDYFLHSVLGVMDVSADLYDKDLDIFSSCRKDD